MHPDEYILVNGRKLLRRGPGLPGGGQRYAVVSNGGDVGVLIILKCASRAMVHSSKVRLRLGRDQLPNEIHVFVRDPIERLRSVYQFFHQSPPIVNREQRGPMEYQEFIDYVLSGKKNQHWQPVTEIMEKVGKPIIVHLFEDISTEYPLGELPVKNVSQWADGIDTTYREPELRSLYDGDYILREEAVANAIRI